MFSWETKHYSGLFTLVLLFFQYYPPFTWEYTITEHTYVILLREGLSYCFIYTIRTRYSKMGLFQSEQSMHTEAWHCGFPVGTSLSALPFNVCLACRVCSLVGVIPRGTRVPWSHRTPINSPLKWEPLHHHDTGLSWWEEEITKNAEE